MYTDYAGIVVLYDFFHLLKKMSHYDILSKKNYKHFLYTYACIHYYLIIKLSYSGSNKLPLIKSLGIKK